LVLFLGPERDAMTGVSAGFMAGLFWVASAMGITYLFERKTIRLFMINAGYHVITFTIMGLILRLEIKNNYRILNASTVKRSNL
jgi:Protein of unknown function (DUF1761)